MDPGCAPAYINIAVTLRDIGRLRDTLPYLEKAAQLGDPTGRQYLAQARQMLGIETSSQVDPAQASFEAFLRAVSLEAMQQTVAQFPFLAQPDFIAMIEQAIAQQVPPEQQPYFEQRLGWLRQIKDEG